MMNALHLLVIASCINILNVAGYSNKNDLNPAHTVFIPPFKDYLKLINFDWFIRNVSMLNDTQCNRDLYSILEALNNNEIWPKLMLDASGFVESGVFHTNSLYLGNYDQCLWTKPKNVNFTTQYCLISINCPLNLKQFGLNYIRDPTGGVGMCLPSTCSREYLKRIISQLKSSDLDKLLNKTVSFDVKQGDCHIVNEQIPFSTLNYITIAIFVLFLTLVVISTLYELYHRNKKEKLPIVFSSFSLIQNVKETMMIGCKKIPANSFNAIKAVSCLLVVHFHSIHLLLPYFSDLIELWNIFFFGTAGFWSTYYQNIFTGVDHFFVMSGVGIVIVFFRSMKSQGKYNPVVFVIKRYIKLMFPFFIIILIRMGISEHLGDGPVYNSINNNLYREKCEGSVWPSVFLYHNYQYSINLMCFQHSWYIPIDMHLYIFSHLIIFAAYWNKMLGFSLAIFMILLCTASEFAVGYIYDLAPSASMDNNHVYYDYGTTHTRAAPWFVGMVFAFIILFMKKRKIRLSKVYVILGWFMCGFSLFLATYPMHYFDFKTFSQPSSAIFLATRRVTWSVFIGWFVFAYTEGYAGSLVKMNSFKIIVFLSNISYEIYIVHELVLEYYVSTTRAFTRLSAEQGLYHSLAMNWISVFCGLIMALTFTRPITKLTNHYLKKIQICTIADKDS